MKKLFTLLFCGFAFVAANAQTCDYQLLGFADANQQMITELTLGPNDDLNPAVVFTNAGPDLPGANDTVWLDLSVIMGGQEAPVGSSYVPGSAVAGWANQQVALSGEQALLTAAEMNEYGLIGTLQICYTVRAGGNVTDPDASNNKACLTVKRGGVGIDGFNAEEINVYPNPATSVINVANAENAQVSVFDINGKLMVSVESATANQAIDASNFANGLYFVRITDGNNVITKKVNVVK